MMEWQKSHAVPISKKGSNIDMTGKFYIGELKKTRSPEYCKTYDELISATQRRKES